MTENHDLPVLTWRKSSYSSGNGQCVEVALQHGRTAIRDSKHPKSALWFGAVAFEALAVLRMSRS